MSPTHPDEPSFLFTDLVASTRMWEEDPVAMDEALARHDALVRQAVDGEGGQVFNTLGDAFHVAFPTAGAAVRAAVAAQRALMSEDWGASLPQLMARMAVHKGPAVQRDDGYFGPTLNRCARLLAVGHGGQILASEAAAAALREEGDRTELRDLGLHRLRDLRSAEHIHQVLAPGLPDDFPPILSLDARPNNLPSLLTAFIGRERQLGEVEAALEQSRLLTLTGPGGCGKTRLALAAASLLTGRFQDGVWLTEFEGLSDPNLVPQAVANALGIRVASRLRPRQDGPLDTAAGGPEGWTERLVQVLEAKTMLLVLDNCEHLIAAIARLADTLLRACPRLRILATSRESLAVAGERVYGVPPLALPPAAAGDDPDGLLASEAVQLFVIRAQQAQPGFALDGANAADVAQICRRLDGIPLAIELAAARVRVLPPAQIAARLDDRFRLLTGGSRTAVPRQQTLRAAFDWSYGLLGEPERVLLRRLAVFHHGFGLEAAEAVCADQALAAGGPPPEDILDLLCQLVDKSLLGVDERPGRYELLETVRQYGLDRLVEAGELAGMRDRHGAWFGDLADRAAAALRGPDQAEWLATLGVEHRNLRAAIAWAIDSGQTRRAQGMAARLWWFWYVRGFLAEGEDWLAQVIALPPEPGQAGEDGALAAELQLGAGALAWRRRDYDRAEAHLDRARAAFRGLGDSRGLARAGLYRGRVAHFRGDYAAAMDAYEDSAGRFRALGDELGLASTLDAMGLCAWHQGRLDEAAGWLGQSLDLAQRTGDLHGMADALNILGRVAHDRGQLDEAIRLYQDSLEVFRSLGDELSLAYGLHKLGSLYCLQGDWDRAEPLLEQALARCRELGERRGVAYALNGLGELALARGDLEGAERHLDESLRLAREIGDKRGIADALRQLGWLASRRGLADEAFVDLHEAMERFVEMGDRIGIAECLTGLALVMEAASPARAARLLGASERMREEVGAALAPELQPGVAEALLRLRARLGETDLQGALAEGRAMETEEALGIARMLLARLLA